MATKIKDSATAQQAALNLNKSVEATERPGEPNTPQEKTTSEKLFPEFMTDDGGVINRPVKPFQDVSKPLPVSATSDPALQGQNPAPQTPTVPVYISESDLKGKMVKLKVDGIEQDVPAESLIKTNQLERHLNTQLMALAEERRKFEAERMSSQQKPPVPSPIKQEPAVKKSVEVEALEARLSQMESFITQQQESMRPALQEAGIKRVEQMVKDKVGADDFRSYFDKVRDIAIAESEKAQTAGDMQSARFFDSDTFYFQKYMEMKTKDLLSKPAVNPNAPVLQAEQGAPMVVNNNGQPVSIPSFESSGGVPSRVNPNASWQSTYNALLVRAKESGRMEDWTAVYRHKIQPLD